MVCQPDAIVCAPEGQTGIMHAACLNPQDNRLTVSLANLDCGRFIRGQMHMPAPSWLSSFRAEGHRPAPNRPGQGSGPPFLVDGAGRATGICSLCSSCLTLVARRAAHAGLLRYRRPQPKSKSAACRECRLAGLCAASEAAIAASVFWLVLVDLAWRWSIRAFWTLTRKSCPR